MAVLVGICPGEIGHLLKKRFEAGFSRKESETADLVGGLLPDFDRFTPAPETLEFDEEHVVVGKGVDELPELVDRFGGLQIATIPEIVLISCPAPIGQTRKICVDE